MKSLLLISIIALSAVFQNSYATANVYLGIDDQVCVEAQVEQNVHNRIMDAFMNSFVEQNNSKMLSLLDELSSLYHKSNNSIFLYWKGYALYYCSIIYLKKEKEINHMKN